LIYYGAFVPGMGEVVAGVLREGLPDVSIIKLLDGAVIFETSRPYSGLNFFCFNNIFAVIDILEAPGTEGAGLLERHIKKAIARGASPVISENNKKIKTFRIVSALENTPAAVDKELRKRAEDFISRESGLGVHRSNPDTEFWFLYRRERGRGEERFSVFMKRLTRRPSFEKLLHRGELTPQLAWLLCRLGELKHGETGVDPFCGYGAIPGAAVKHFPVKKFFASDRSGICVQISRNKGALKNTGRCEIREADIHSVFDFMHPGEADAIITDPPWGMYQETAFSLGRLYDGMIAVFSRLLKDGGRAVILTAAGEELLGSLKKTPALRIDRIIPILVSGKKAAVFTLKKV
jgi:tRNA G10  N-methylase Trm11